AGLIDATTGTTSGNFEYGPFGETIRLTPNSNNQSPFRFSTKYQDDESDLVYYGFRYFNPSTGRWLGRDPLGEVGFECLRGGKSKTLGSGSNLYAFLSNDPLDQNDYLGLEHNVITAP